MSHKFATSYQFGDWRVDSQRNELSRDGKTKHLEPKILDVLRYLLDHPGEVVSTEALMEAVWPGRAIEPVGVARNVAHIRRALGDDSQNPSYIETIPKRGYRTIAAVSVADSTQPATDAIATKPKARRAVQAAIIGASVVLYMHPEPVDSSQEHSIAVLPFVNLSPSSAYDYLVDGIAHELIQMLSNVPTLRVSSATASSYFKGKQVSVPSVGAELNVQYLVEGSVRIENGLLRANVQLTSVDEGFEVWSRSYDHSLNDMLRLQSELSRAIVSELPLLLKDEDFAAAIEAGTTNPAAYDALLRGIAIFQSVQFPEQMEDAKGLFREAISLDPSFYAPYAWLATAIDRSAGYPNAGSPGAAAMEAIGLLETVEALDTEKARPGRPDHLWMLLRLKREWAKLALVIEEQLARRAAEARWYYRYGRLLDLSGLPRAALAYLKEAERLEPLNVEYKFRVGQNYADTRQPEKALVKLEESLQIQPTMGEAITYKAFSLILLGDHQRGLAILSDGVWNASSTRCVFLVLAEKRCDPTEHYDAVLTASVTLAVLTRDYDRAFKQLNQAIEQDHPFAIFFRTQAHAWPEEFHADPRWHEFLRAVGQTDEWRDELCGRAQRLAVYTGIDVTCPES